jgi:hypothetical protein
MTRLRNTPLARVRAQRKALRAEMARLQKMAKDALAEFDELLASRLRELKAGDGSCASGPRRHQ